MVRMTSWFTRLVGGRPRAACWWRGGRRGGASGAEPSVNLTQTCPAGPGQPRETNNNLESVRSGLKKPRSVASDDRVQRISCHRTRTTRIALTSRGAAPTSLPTFCLKFCLHWVELSPRNCMDPDTRRWHGIYQMCRIMTRSLHFNRRNARDAQLQEWALVTRRCNFAQLCKTLGWEGVVAVAVCGRLAIES